MVLEDLNQTARCEIFLHVPDRPHQHSTILKRELFEEGSVIAGDRFLFHKIAQPIFVAPEANSVVDVKTQDGVKLEILGNHWDLVDS